jgi:hypothetical protein
VCVCVYNSVSVCVYLYEYDRIYNTGIFSESRPGIVFGRIGGASGEGKLICQIIMLSM